MSKSAGCKISKSINLNVIRETLDIDRNADQTFATAPSFSKQASRVSCLLRLLQKLLLHNFHYVEWIPVSSAPYSIHFNMFYHNFHIFNNSHFSAHNPSAVSWSGEFSTIVNSRLNNAERLDDFFDLSTFSITFPLTKFDWNNLSLSMPKEVLSNMQHYTYIVQFCRQTLFCILYTL